MLQNKDVIHGPVNALFRLHRESPKIPDQDSFTVDLDDKDLNMQL